MLGKSALRPIWPNITHYAHPLAIPEKDAATLADLRARHPDWDAPDLPDPDEALYQRALEAGLAVLLAAPRGNKTDNDAAQIAFSDAFAAVLKDAGK